MGRAGSCLDSTPGSSLRIEKLDEDYRLVSASRSVLTVSMEDRIQLDQLL